ncbi:UDP-Glycosyltransferase/glycogen phosphorylase [Ascobolus immersus RN42]|uniref:UDP-Glycosyltransferase/glycogen phosphorylase n=1 Tax=Ascobolus immersus RN42 TaxID=1160509 RepID=A0A3N4I3G4_ASCIM|nr:UDP-Glycosyltransferase/glycogen phosphorylase [Ascobolus immersus RN42]
MDESAIHEADGFESQPSQQLKRRMSMGSHAEQWARLIASPMYFGIACDRKENVLEVAVTIHDGTYSTDYSVSKISLPENATKEQVNEAIKNYVRQHIPSYFENHVVKFIGCGVSQTANELCPDLCSLLWREYDIVPIVFHVHSLIPGFSINSKEGTVASIQRTLLDIDVGEQADSAARKCVIHFGPQHIPRLMVGFRNEVEVDAGGRIKIVGDLEEYRHSMRNPKNWDTLMKYVDDLRTRKVKIAFFNSTPQGGGVALMRHSMIRFLRVCGIDARWYVPQPNPRVFRTTKTNHNILQGVADPNVRLEDDQKKLIDEWIKANAQSKWLLPGGPLDPDGGADVIIIDDHQMPGLIPIIKAVKPNTPVIFRSHIELRGDLIHKEGSPQAGVWEYLSKSINLADLFISHPVTSFIPQNFDPKRIGLLPASTDWLDGLNKPLADWDLRYYHHTFATQCSNVHIPKLQYPSRSYICQIARFDPAKGIPDLIDAYVRARKLMDSTLPFSAIPQLLICGHGAIDDPDASIVSDQVMGLLQKEPYSQFAHDIVVMHIGPSDQMLNALISTAKFVCQLSTREGFEVKVSEALHKGKPVIATRAGGIPLQIQDGKNGFLVEIGDTRAVARHMFNLCSDQEMYSRMSSYAKVSVSDEVHTPGQCISWLYLASKLTKGEKVEPNGRWINDMAREEAGLPYEEGELRLHRDITKLEKQPLYGEGRVESCEGKCEFLATRLQGEEKEGKPLAANGDDENVAPDE